MMKGLTNEQKQRVEDLLQKMTLEEKIGQMIMTDIRFWNEHPDDPDSKDQGVEELNDELREYITKNRFGGVILFGENCKENEQTIRFVNELHKANQDVTGKTVIPLLIAADQEGGNVARLGQGTRWTGAMALTAAHDPTYAYETGKRIGEELAALNITTDFAPVLDVNSNPSNPVIGLRSFSDIPEVVKEYGMSYLKGLKSTGTIISLKHFPGHGDVATDSHTGFPILDKTYEELKETELKPYQEAVNNGADMIMTAHIQYPQIETNTYISITTGERVYVPATMSKTILTDILRNDMGYEGIIVTDGLNMAAITDHFALHDVGAMAINAGVDLILIPVSVHSTETVKQMEDFIADMAASVKSGEISEARVNESVRRLLTLKEKHGLLDPVSTELSEADLKAAKEIPGSQENLDYEWEIMQKAVTLLKNEGDILPITAKENETALFLYSAPSRIACSDFAYQRLIQEGLVPESVKFTGMECVEDKHDECIEAVKDADYIIAVNTAFSLTDMDPSQKGGKDSAVMDDVIAAAHENGKKIILLSSYLPYDAARFPDADAIVLCYCSAPMRTLPENGEFYSPNVPAAICGIFGEYEFAGKLPVNIPAMNGSYQFTETIAYPREVTPAKSE